MRHPQVRPDPALGLLQLYDDALPHVYGYLLARCGDAGLAEDLTAESFLAAVHAIRKQGAPDPSIPWLIGVARHKLADHWRQVEREQRGLRLLDGEPAHVDDPWETAVDRIRAHEVLDRLGAHHRAALTLRYLDGLPVAEVARHLDRTVHATEALLVRARAAFRRDLRGRGGVAVTDPFEALREPVTPVDPDPGFAGRLPTRLTREVFARTGGTMSQQPAAVSVERQRAAPPTLTPYIVVSDARRAIDWYVGVFGAQPRGELHVNADETIGHAEVGIGDAVLMLSEASGLWPDVPVRAPDSPATFSHSLHLEVGDVDGTTERARLTGASVEREPADQPYGRSAVIVDPFGHRWILLRTPAGGTRQGDVAPSAD
jgi:RNA polymerase sigma-70 factor, ECF subfamily